CVLTLLCDCSHAPTVCSMYMIVALLSLVSVVCFVHCMYADIFCDVFGVLCWVVCCVCVFFFFSSRRRHTRLVSDWSSDVCSSDLAGQHQAAGQRVHVVGDGQADGRALAD